jgi:hypothetical protein
MDCDGRHFFEAWFFSASHWKKSDRRRFSICRQSFLGSASFREKFIEKIMLDVLT